MTRRRRDPPPRPAAPFRGLRDGAAAAVFIAGASLLAVLVVWLWRVSADTLAALAAAPWGGL